jgi:predicted ATPase/DNA-binding SARP family transcriptional activator
LAAVLEFGVLGPLEVRADGRSLRIGGQRTKALLAVLLLDANEPVATDRLIEALWGERPPRDAVNAVQVHVSRLRRALGAAGSDAASVLTTRASGYLLRLEDEQLDLWQFRSLAERGRAALDAGQYAEARALLTEALALWRGPPLADLAYESFAQADIAALQELRLAALEDRVDADIALGCDSRLIAELGSLVAAHPGRERIRGQLMLALYCSGRQAEALEEYRRARAHLVDELGLEPGPALQRLQRQILTHDPHLAASATPTGPVCTAGLPPAPPTPMFGREADIEAVAVLVRGLSTRLVTLVGLGGVGKTRLAIELARHLAQDFRDGARLVELASLSEQEHLASAIGRALAAPQRPGEQAQAALLRWLAGRHLLLVLDNFEHLVDGAPLLSELLAGAPELTMLVTSRRPTCLAAERRYPVRPLEVPEQTTAGPEELQRYGAVAMFCDRARARDPDFMLDETSASHVLDICRRLDGLPLALELAAARIGLLSPGELAARLTPALTVLVGGARDAPARQRTLRATIEWSVRLLGDEERGAFVHFAVLTGGATVPTAEIVTGASLDTLDSLVSQQLLVRRDQRLLMLETVREYALELLAADPDAETVRNRLAAWCVGFVREATPHLVQADRAAWLARLDAELPNALAALTWALDSGRAELALGLVGELADYWWYGYRWEDGRPWVQRALEHGHGASVHGRAKALLARARLAGTRSHEAQCRNDVRSSLELFEVCDDPAGMSACLSHMAIAAMQTGDYEEASALADQAMRSAERSRDRAIIALALRANVAARRGYSDVMLRAHSAVKYLEGAGDLLSLAWVCNLTAYVAIFERRYEEALQWLADGLGAARRLNDAHCIFLIRGNEGLARLLLHQLDESAEAFAEGLAVCRQAGDEDIADEPLLGLAAITALQGDRARAAQLAGAAHAHRAERDLYEEAIWSRLEDLLAPARIEFGAAKWDRAQREGSGLSVPQAIELALVRGRFAAANNGPGDSLTPVT